MFAEMPADNWDDEMIEIKEGNHAGILMSAQVIFDDKWSQLAQPLFWKEIMQLSKDSLLVNVGSTREVVMRIPTKVWNAKSGAEKVSFRDSVRVALKLAEDESILCTTGKRNFYKFEKVYKSLAKGILAFEENKVDPWYAQAILLIESPGQMNKSTAGAYGPFQLMPRVARAQGLTVNKTLDEREDFKRSAYAASSLIKKICIPYAKSMLDEHELKYDESDLWFRLFVMHIYHAGANNVKAVLDQIQPEEGGQDLITCMWQNKAAKFGNASQNYSQVILASQMILHEMVSADSEKLFACTK